jgi:hypothetical protein
MYAWLVFVHVLGGFLFAMAHGASANVAFRLRHETSRERTAALLDLSTTYLNAMYLGLVVLLISGIVAGLMGNWWGRGWIWTALALLVAEFVAMFFMGTRPFARLRKAAGVPYFENMRPQPPAAPAADAEIAALAAAISPLPITVVGFGGLALIIWLMMFKPF